MPIPLAIGLGLTAAAGLVKGGIGLSQMNKAKRGLAELERPEYKMPDAVKQSLALAQARLRAMPGYRERMEGITSSTGNAASLARESGNPLLAIAGIQSMENNARRQLAVDRANYDVDRSKDLSASLMNFAKYKDMEFQMNEYAPYVEKYNELREQLGAGQQNLTGALGDMGSGFLSASLGGFFPGGGGGSGSMSLGQMMSIPGMPSMY